LKIKLENIIVNTSGYKKRITNDSIMKESDVDRILLSIDALTFCFNELLKYLDNPHTLKFYSYSGEALKIQLKQFNKFIEEMTIKTFEKKTPSSDYDIDYMAEYW